MGWNGWKQVRSAVYSVVLIAREPRGRQTRALKRRRNGGAARRLVATLAIMIPSVLQGQAAGVTRAAIIQAEDARGKGPEGIDPILAGLKSPSLRAIAIRAVGRLERPDLVGHIIPYLDSQSVRAITAEALAQALQGLPAPERRTAVERALVDSVFRILCDRATAENDASTKGILARSIARLPFGESRQARAADSVLIKLAPIRIEQRESYPAMAGVAHGLYTLARSRRTLGNLSPPSVDWLRRAALLGLREPGANVVRRPAWLALTANGTVDRRDVSGAISEDTDPQVRRLAVAALPNVQDSTFQREQLARVAHERDPTIRLEWVRVYRLLVASLDCGPLLAALSDTVQHVRLAAIDALAGPCPDRDKVAAALRTMIDAGPGGATPRSPRGVSWHARAHALVALARVDSGVARELLRRDSHHPVWQVRMYVARGATAIRDTVLLTSLSLDTIGNVREVAIQGLSTTLGHLADLVYVRALGSPDYHVVLAAARALRGAPVRDSILPALVSALERLTREQRQTSRDPRMELLARVQEMGTSETVSRLRPLLRDVDPAVASEAASVMNHLSGGQQFAAAPAQNAHRPVTPPSGAVRVRVRMSATTGGGTFDVLLDADRAPMTVARVLELIRDRYYDGLTFHRVVPNFVLQGGSPGMNEYVGDGPFLRDELSAEHHARYTLGISTRGRDTGDAQWFINLVDNYRLDHEYTVIGKIVVGFDVVDRILEGDIMESVRIVPDR